MLGQQPLSGFQVELGAYILKHRALNAKPYILSSSLGVLRGVQNLGLEVRFWGSLLRTILFHVRKHFCYHAKTKYSPVFKHSKGFLQTPPPHDENAYKVKEQS